MKRLLVLSDTHGRVEEAVRVIERINEMDGILHLGDLVRDANEIAAVFPNIPVYAVRGNNDYGYPTPHERIVSFGDFRIYCIHGHTAEVRHLVEHARENGCDAALYGHTHRSECVTESGILILNPGSLTRPRDGQCSFGVLEIDGGKLKGCVCGI